ncbi:MAG: glycoside hydrolase family 78 protein [Tannerella sp.]|nr:glycoside hydrolase family 78 protein [Tannerella sp.]
MEKSFLLSLLLLWITGCTTNVGTGSVTFAEVQTEMRENPEGLGVEKPRFSWKFISDKPDVMQAAYRIEVAASMKDLKAGSGLLWDSGEVDSDQSLWVEYAGKTLESGKKYFWRVTIRTNQGEMARSDVRHWSMGLLNDSDWSAKWIGLNDEENLKVEKNRTILPARYLRKEFKIASKPKRAMLYVSGVGSSVCYLNGKTIGEDVFGPLPTWYDASVPYLAYDVTSCMKKGDNAIGVALGNGRFLTMRERGMLGFGLPRLIAQLNIEYENGEQEMVVSDDSWMATAKGPITENNEFDGEKYDARLELGRWTETGYDASAWRKAERMEAPKGKLTAQLSPSLKVMEEIKPVSVKPVGEGRYIVDMGQNMVGLLKGRLKGKKDQPVTLRFAEVLNADATGLYMDNLRGALVTDVYTPADDGPFTWEPLFVYHGFRFAEISGLDYEPATADFTGKVIYDPMATTGSFETSDELINKLHKNSYWGIRGNYRGMPTDCPQRDERLGWLGDRATGAYGESFLFNNAQMYNKWLVDIEESMNENGSISVVSPRYWTIFNDDVTWPAAYFYIADMLYRQFGDVRSIRARYPSMKKWIGHMTETQMQDYIILKDTYGDWCMPPESPELIHSQDPSRKTSGQVLSTTVFYSILQLMQQFAVINGLPADAEEYATLAARIKEAYNRKFFNAETARYDNNTVTANILSLQLGLVPEGYEEKVFANIVEKTEVDCKGHVSVGVLGIQHLMRGLTEHGNLELAYRIVTNETYPSWGYMINNGATTIWELWNGDTANPGMNSHNHVMLLGDLLIWFYENLAGIKNDPSAVGFKKIWMEPVFPEKLGHVDASYESPYGRIESCWKREGDKLTWNITIPANTTATVKLPVRFGVKADTNRPGVRKAKEADGFLTLELGSGAYLLQSE